MRRGWPWTSCTTITRQAATSWINVQDDALDAAAGTYDNYKDLKKGQGTGNYVYDLIGNLISNDKGDVADIEWTVYGKIAKVTKKNGTVISYSYDASGNRISKTIGSKQTWYVRDASGNVMSVYTKDATVNSGALTQTEVHLYGSSRLGILERNISPGAGISLTGGFFERGWKRYELSNHLGNVLVTISDRNLPVDADGNGTIDYYTADVQSAQDYYPFGLKEPGRQYGTPGRYGFNGKEDDPETGTQDYGFRIYNPALGRFLSTDPLQTKFPFYTPYQFAGNMPIWAIDLDGLEPVGYSDMSAAKAPDWKRISNAEDIEIKNSSKLQGTISHYDIKDFKGAEYTVFKQELIFVGYANRMQKKVNFFYLDANINHPQSAATYSVKGNPVGALVPFRAQEQVDADNGATISDNFSKAIFWTGAFISAAPFMEATGGAHLFETNFTSVRGLMNFGANVAGNAVAQQTLDPEKPINWYAAVMSGIFQNGWTSGAASSLISLDENNNPTLSDGRSFFLGTIFSGATNSLNNAVFGSYGPKPGIPLREKIVRGYIQAIPAYGANLGSTAATNAANSPSTTTTNSNNNNPTNETQHNP